MTLDTGLRRGTKTIFACGLREIPLTLRPMRSARGLRLSIDLMRAHVLLTMPARGSRMAALAWVEERRGWIEAVLAGAPQGRPFVSGAVIPLDDNQLTIEWRHDGPRAPQLLGDRLHIGGAEDRLAAKVGAWLKSRSLTILSADTAHFAARADVAVTRVSVGDPRRRWGSCGSGGAIAYSWRLGLAPRFVRRSVVAHEVAHRLHMDHSPAFHAAHARVLGEDPTPARNWLRRHGAELHLLGRDV